MSDRYRGYRMPKSIIGYAVSFCLNLLNIVLTSALKIKGGAQKFPSSMDIFLNLLKVGRYKYSAQDYREKLKMAFEAFNDVVCSSQNYA